MREMTGPDGRSVEVTLRRTRAARRISLRVSGLDGRATLSFPPGIGAGEVDRFLLRHRDWLLDNALRADRGETVRPGLLIPFQGNLVLIECQRAGRGPVRVKGDRLIVPADPARTGVRLKAFLKASARDAIAADLDTCAARSGQSPGRLRLRDTRSRWGSCSAAGDLMFSWRLIMAPAEVRRYVVAHEVAHLTHMDHSPAFWAHVETLMPGHAAPRAWLRRHGKGLHRYRFD